MPIVLTSLFIYPVKSFRGCAVSSAEVDPLGLVGDRRFLVVAYLFGFRCAGAGREQGLLHCRQRTVDPLDQVRHVFNPM